MDNPALAWNSVFLGQLLVVAWIDHRHMIIPNWLNVSIAFTGLLFGLLTGQQTLLPMTEAGISAFLVMWMVRALYYVLTKRSGLGMGDVKFVAALAIWVGFSNLPLVILVASVSALSLLMVKQAISGLPLERDARLAFGPHLAIGAASVWAFLKVSFPT